MKKIFLVSLLMLPVMLWAQIAIKADVIYPVSAMPIRDGVVLIKDGKIQSVGTAASISIPADYKIYTAKFTDATDKDPFFDQKATAYIAAQKLIYSDSKNVKQHFKKRFRKNSIQSLGSIIENKNSQHSV